MRHEGRIAELEDLETTKREPKPVPGHVIFKDLVFRKVPSVY